MGMSPVRRAFVILFIAAAVVALGLVLAQDQVTLRVRSAVSAEDPRHAELRRGARRRGRSRAATPTTS